ncbi:hypothetical protein D3C87_1558500 [compost metagenome]
MDIRTAGGFENFVHQAHQVPVDRATESEGRNTGCLQLLCSLDQLVIGLRLLGDARLFEHRLVVIQALAGEAERHAVLAGTVALGKCQGRARQAVVPAVFGVIGGNVLAEACLDIFAAKPEACPAHIDIRPSV